MKFILSHDRFWQVVDDIGKILQNVVGTLGWSYAHLSVLLFWPFIVQFHLKGEIVFVFFFQTQMTLPGSHKGPCAQGDMVQVIGTQLYPQTKAAIKVAKKTSFFKFLHTIPPILK